MLPYANRPIVKLQVIWLTRQGTPVNPINCRTVCRWPQQYQYAGNRKIVPLVSHQVIAGETAADLFLVTGLKLDMNGVAFRTIDNQDLIGVRRDDREIGVDDSNVVPDQSEKGKPGRRRGFDSCLDVTSYGFS